MSAIILLVIASFFYVSCATKTRNVQRKRRPKTKDGPIETPEIDIQDFRKASSRLVENLSKNFDFHKGKGETNTVAVGQVRNNTALKIQPHLLTTKFEMEIAKRQDAEVYAGPDIIAQQWVKRAREMSESPQTTKNALSEIGNTRPPKYVLIADILERDQQHKGVKQNTYVFQARIFDIEKNAYPWVDEVTIIEKKK
ncbi:MAG: hypothetical protein KGZ25_01540 [Planctomycetes bacterium]|nr:hypothetical protein [Planctomycetota bacterium]